MKLTERKVSSILRRQGYKLTPQRRAVLNAIAANKDHLTPAEIFERVRREYPGIGLVTIYRTLDIIPTSDSSVRCTREVTAVAT